MKIRIEIYYCLFIIFLSSCNSEKSNLIPRDVYNIPIIFIDTTSESYLKKQPNSSFNYKSESAEADIDTNLRYNKQMKIKYNFVKMHSRLYKHLIFKNDTLEILFSKYYKNLNSSHKYIFLSCLIGVNKLEKSFSECLTSSFCYYILWLNKNDKNYGEICSDTDTIYSNIDNKIIQNIFPNFKGVLVDPKIYRIIVDYRIPIDANEFYYKIQFDGFSRFKY